MFAFLNLILKLKSTLATSFFLGTIFLCVEKLKEQLSQLKEKFSWSDQEMMSGIGIPSEHVNNLKNGIYRTHLKETVKRSAAVRLNLEMMSVFPDIHTHSGYEDEDEEYGDNENDDKVKKNHLTSQDISEQEVSVMSLTDNSIEKVEMQLSEVCEDIFTSLEKRFKPT